MKFSNEQLEEFIGHYNTRCGIKLNKQEAIEKATKLVKLVQCMLRADLIQ